MKWFRSILWAIATWFASFTFSVLLVSLIYGGNHAQADHLTSYSVVFSIIFLAAVVSFWGARITAQLMDQKKQKNQDVERKSDSKQNKDQSKENQLERPLPIIPQTPGASDRMPPALLLSLGFALRLSVFFVPLFGLL